MNRRSRTAGPFPAGAGIFHRMYTRLGLHGRPPHFAVSFFPYANLTHTIRLEGDGARARLSDVLQRAPLDVLEATAGILLARLYRRQTPREWLDCYREFALQSKTRRRLNRLRGRRGRDIAHAPQGRHHNLEPLFTALNRRYFGSALPRPRLGWSRRPWRAQLGCFDPALNQIVMSSRLDRPGVPRCVVEYVLYHEMLHVRHPLRRAKCGLQAHSRAFREQEKRFHDYLQARRFLKKLR